MNSRNVKLHTVTCMSGARYACAPYRCTYWIESHYHLLIGQHWIHDISIAIHSRFELVIYHDGLLFWMCFEHATTESSAKWEKRDKSCINWMVMWEGKKVKTFYFVWSDLKYWFSCLALAKVGDEWNIHWKLDDSLFDELCVFRLHGDDNISTKEWTDDVIKIMNNKR